VTASVPASVNIGAKNPPRVIRSDPGNGANGIPTETIQNRAITNAKLANESVNSEKIAPGGVTVDRLAEGQRQYWAVVQGLPIQVLQASDPAITAIRPGEGDFQVNFGTDVSGCSANAVPYAEFGAGFPGAQTAFIVRGSTPDRLEVRTLNPLSEMPPAVAQQAESNFMMEVFC
jgi:hypothetical protein